jgi:phosphoglycolate phosphatase-like HAD superfamily hydrolase
MSTTPLQIELVVFDLATLLNRNGPGKAQSEAAFQRLHDAGIKVVVSTDLDRQTTRDFLSGVGWEDHELIDMVVTGKDMLQVRPEPDMIFFAMRTLGINNPAQVAKLGDSMLDIEEARNANCGAVIALATGSHSADELRAAGPTAVVNSLEEFVALVLPAA